MELVCDCQACLLRCDSCNSSFISRASVIGFTAEGFVVDKEDVSEDMCAPGSAAQRMLGRTLMHCDPPQIKLCVRSLRRACSAHFLNLRPADPASGPRAAGPQDPRQGLQLALGAPRVMRALGCMRRLARTFFA